MIPRLQPVLGPHWHWRVSSLVCLSALLLSVLACKKLLVLQPQHTALLPLCTATSPSTAPACGRGVGSPSSCPPSAGHGSSPTVTLAVLQCPGEDSMWRGSSLGLTLELHFPFIPLRIMAREIQAPQNLHKSCKDHGRWTATPGGTSSGRFWVLWVVLLQLQPMAALDWGRGLLHKHRQLCQGPGQDVGEHYCSE